MELSAVLQERSEELAVGVDPVAVVDLVVVDGAVVEAVCVNHARAVCELGRRPGAKETRQLASVVSKAD